MQDMKKQYTQTSSGYPLSKGGARTNRGVVYRGPNQVAVEDVGYPLLKNPALNGRPAPHAVIIKILVTNICGSDLHMYRGRTTAQPGMVFGHENTGIVHEIGEDVETVAPGDLVSVPFNVACGRCINCFKGQTNICLNTNPEVPGAAYGYVMMGPWPGGQTDYLLVPYADFNLLKIDNKEAAMARILDIALLSDVLPTAFDAAWRNGCGVKPGDSVYIAGAGPIGLTAAACCLQLLGAAVVVVGDFESSRLRLAERLGAKTIDLNSVKNGGAHQSLQQLLGNTQLADLIRHYTGGIFVDVAIDCTGYECCGMHGMGKRSQHERTDALNDCSKVLRFGGHCSVPAVYLPADPGASDLHGKKGEFTLDWGLQWAKGLSFTTGQCAVKNVNYRLLEAILADRLQVAKYLNPVVISLEQAPEAYANVSRGAAVKYFIDPHGMLPSSIRRSTGALTMEGR